MKTNLRSYIDNFDFRGSAIFEPDKWRQAFDMLLASLTTREDGRVSYKKLSRKKS